VKVLIDTNIILDIALNRKPFVAYAALLWRLAEQKQITACLSNTSITDIFYIVRKHAGIEKARGLIADILDTFSLADIDEQGFREALNSDMGDFEDAVQYVVCTRNDCDALITRNKVDFGDRPNVFDPAELIEKLRSPQPLIKTTDIL
jgi:predicted nucleic acid-binding protein